MTSTVQFFADSNFHNFFSEAIDLMGSENVKPLGWPTLKIVLTDMPEQVRDLVPLYGGLITEET